MNTYKGVVLGLALGLGLTFLFSSFDSNVSLSAIYLPAVILGGAGWVIDSITKIVIEKGEQNVGWIVEAVTKNIEENRYDNK